MVAESESPQRRARRRRLSTASGVSQMCLSGTVAAERDSVVLDEPVVALRGVDAVALGRARTLAQAAALASAADAPALADDLAVFILGDADEIAVGESFGLDECAGDRHVSAPCVALLVGEASMHMYMYRCQVVEQVEGDKGEQG